MRATEAAMQCKVRKGGLREDRRTGEMLYSKFFHRDSRPINGLSDPHWHVHCFLHNATFDPVEERLRRLPARERAAIPEFLSFSGWFSLSSAGVVDRLAQAQGTLVKDDQSSPAGGVNRFQTTRWSVVLVSAQSQAPGYKQALADLCKLYWYPLYAFVRHRGYSPEDAQDLVQGFFLHLIEYRTLSRVDRSKGKFRSFLLASLKNYLANEMDRARCLKRGGKTAFVHIDLEKAEDRYELEPVEELTPEKIFDARWAIALLGEAMNRLSCEYIAQGKEGTFRALKAFLDPINTKRLPSYEEVAAELEVSIGSLKKQIHRLRKQYTATVREEISRTVSDSADVDTETHELCEALIAAEEGWVIP